jgi:hypothetical protein
MAVDHLQATVRQVVSLHLAVNQRYRCLVFQSADLATLSALRALLTSLVTSGDVEPGLAPFVLDGAEQFDERGALACADVLAMIDAHSLDRHALLVGPLHFLDYWSLALRGGFWSHLATVTRGPGVIVVDTPRGIELDDTFRVLGRISGTDVRYLKSRLVATQDRTA